MRDLFNFGDNRKVLSLEGEIMGFLRNDVFGGLRACIKAMQDIGPGVHQAMAECQPPTHVMVASPPFKALRHLHRETTTLIGRLARAQARQRAVQVPASTVELLRMVGSWIETNLKNNVDRSACMTLVDVRTYTNAALALHEADRGIRQRNTWHSVMELERAWDHIGAMMHSRDDVLVVTGKISYSEGIRQHALAHLASQGKKGAWWLYTLDGPHTWRAIRHVTHGLEDASTVVHFPESYFGGVVYDGRTERWMTPSELGHDMQPAL